MTVQDEALDLRADFPDKVVLLNVWASWCGPCKSEMPSLRKLQQKYGPRGLQIIGVNVDNHEHKKRAQRVIQQYGLDFPNIFDPTSRYANALGASALPTTVLLDRNFKMHWGHQGTFSFDDPKIHEVIEELLNAQPNNDNPGRK